MTETQQKTFKTKFDTILISFLLISWSIFQLSLPTMVLLSSIQIKSIHLAFAVTLSFLCFPAWKKDKLNDLESTSHNVFWPWYIFAAVGAFASLYYIMNYEEISDRSGILHRQDVIFGVIAIICLLEASRRVLGIALSLIAIFFSCYCFFAASMPDAFAMKNVSLTKYIYKIVLSDAGIYGVPLDVSANTVFLFVLLGSMLNKVGAGHFFNDLAISMLGRFKGGPAKAAVVSSGLTGLVSGSSIANVVTTGTFTIPLMKKVGYPPEIAAATEVAASTNGQLMPPIMGAAAFIIAEYTGCSYFMVVKAAIIPAVVSYIALFYITHLEACKLNMSGLSAAELPNFWKTLKSGTHFLIPLAVLIDQLIIVRHSPKMAAFYAIITLIAIEAIRFAIPVFTERESIKKAFCGWLSLILDGLMEGAQNMISVALATATAGIVVGVVTMGIGSKIIHIVEFLSQGNIFLVLLITAIASLILGMGLPTTATYIVMASVTVPVILELNAGVGALVIPAIAAHLFCFYFGILADDTPPVGLAAYAASAIAKSSPIATGVQGFIYDLRTALIPFMFVFNPDILLFNITSWWQGILIFAMATFGALAFTNAMQGWFIIKSKWSESLCLIVAAVILFCPATVIRVLNMLPWSNKIEYSYSYYFYSVGLLIYAAVYEIQRIRSKKNITA